MADDPKSYDASTKWSPLPVWSDATMDGEGYSVRPVDGLCRLLVSGKTDAAIKAAMPRHKPVGFMGVTADENAVLQVARDRVLMVCDKPLDLAPGWHKAGYAVSPADDAWMCLELKGDNRLDMLAQGTSLDPRSASASAMVQFAGVGCLVHQTNDGRILLHVETGQAAYLWTWFAGVGL